MKSNYSQLVGALCVVMAFVVMSIVTPAVNAGETPSASLDKPEYTFYKVVSVKKGGASVQCCKFDLKKAAWSQPFYLDGPSPMYSKGQVFVTWMTASKSGESAFSYNLFSLKVSKRILAELAKVPSIDAGLRDTEVGVITLRRRDNEILGGIKQLGQMTLKIP
jgi:hypothetical protein